MTIPMDNSADHTSKERVQQLFNKNVELENKRREAAQARIPSDPNTWHQMRDNYEAIVLEDQEFSEKHELELALWQLHYRRIEELRGLFNAARASAGSSPTPNGRGPMRGGFDRIERIRTQLRMFLSEASGFYHDFMLKIRAKYGLPLGSLSDDSDDLIFSSKDGNRSTEVKKGIISCHRCLIYLGDLARYKGLYGEGESRLRDFAAASSYYMQASALSPSSGNPHHQLAIIASYSGNELAVIYRYFRSLAVDNPFTTAKDNLMIAFEKNLKSYSLLLGDVKASSIKATTLHLSGKAKNKGESTHSEDNQSETSSVKEKAASKTLLLRGFGTRFVRLNGILFTHTSLEMFAEVLSAVINDLLELLSSGPDDEYYFGSDVTECGVVIVQVIGILIFTVHNANKEPENLSYAEILQRSVLLQNAFTAIFELMGHILQRCAQLNDPSASFLLPGILIFLEWLACHQDIAVGREVEEKQAGARSFFWDHFVMFFNKILSSQSTRVDVEGDDECFFSMSHYDEIETSNRLALPEDFELRGFLPLIPAQLILDFSRKHSLGSEGRSKEKRSRIQRIIAAGNALANVVTFGEKKIYFDSKVKKFLIGVEPKVSDDYAVDCSLVVPELRDVEQENPLLGQKVLGALQRKSSVCVEAEEEDEVIVFKPSLTEKFLNGLALDGDTFPEASASGLISAKTDLGNKNVLFSTVTEGFLGQNPVYARSSSSRAFMNTNTQFLQPIQRNMGKWQTEQISLANGMANLNILENNLFTKSEFDHLGIVQSVAFPVPSHQSIKYGAGDSFPRQATGTVPDFDLITSGATDNDSVKTAANTSAFFSRNPVSRPPLRRLGPPPGFSSFPPKFMEETSLAPSTPQMDDYSWLDGYKLPSSNQSVGYKNSISYSGSTYLPVSNSSGLTGFPFPGKQTSALQVQIENQKSWQDYVLSEQMRLEKEQQQQLQRGNEQSHAFSQQYQGQSLREGRFVV